MKKKLSEILAPMSFSEKRAYLWEYYKIHLLVSIVIIALIIATATSFGDKKDVVLNLVVMGESVDSLSLESLKETMNSELLTEDESKDYTVSVRSIQYSSGQMDMHSSVGLQKMAAEVATKSIDIFVVEKALFEQLNNDGQLLPFEEISGIDLSSFNESELYSSALKEDQVIGFNPAGMKIFENVIYNDDFVLCIPGNTENLQRISQFFEIIS
ncbi:hypothetical protein [Bacillus sp. PS06]|uniref:hypothetical protein n=1 Tax=Bacillus sp. PS06 TaxID=2764176 RepID=UPI00178502E9|nr:hypothetical protein [Bacillus sp. PS06]MBD8068635.1 hypothetical protein [Bacillus sp. PS06]